MAWVYIVIALGSAGFLVWILIEYLNIAAGLKPKAENARREIQEVEMKIESGQVEADSTRQEVEDLKKEVAEMEKELKTVEKSIGQLQDNERRRNPTKFRVEE